MSDEVNRKERQREFTIYLVLFILLVIVGAIGYQKQPEPVYQPQYYGYGGYPPYGLPSNNFYPGLYSPYGYGGYAGQVGYPPWGYQAAPAGYGVAPNYPMATMPAYGWY